MAAAYSAKPPSPTGGVESGGGSYSPTPPPGGEKKKETAAAAKQRRTDEGRQRREEAEDRRIARQVDDAQTRNGGKAGSAASGIGRAEAAAAGAEAAAWAAQGSALKRQLMRSTIKAGSATRESQRSKASYPIMGLPPPRRTGKAKRAKPQPAPPQHEEYGDASYSEDDGGGFETAPAGPVVETPIDFGEASSLPVEDPTTTGSYGNDGFEDDEDEGELAAPPPAWERQVERPLTSSGRKEV